MDPKRKGRTRVPAAAWLLAALLPAMLGSDVAASAVGTVDWPAYLYDAGHSSFSATATAITPANAASLGNPVWNWKPDPPVGGQPAATLYASPTVYGGTIYIGANTGMFYAIDEATHSVKWKRDLGYATGTTCGKKGITATASLAVDPATGDPTVYVGSGDGRLYALKASTGRVVWKSVIKLPSPTVSDYYDWSSPTVVNGRIYIGISSQCDSPLVRGGEKGFDQATGRAIGTYYSMPKGTVGGSIWSSAASDGTSLWVTTGNSDPSLPDTEQGDSFSIVQLDGTTMKREKKWTIPGQAHTDRDWGGSPTLFSATIGGKTVSLVGAADKDGYFYAFRRNALGNGPVWKTLIGSTPGSNNDVCIAAAIWDGTRLFAACNLTKIGVTTYDGSVRQLDPATGGVIWERGLDGAVLGSPTLDGAGVIAASTWKGAGPKKKATTYLLDAASGQVLKDYPTSGGSSVFGQPVFADGDLLVASIDQGLFAYKAP